MSACCLIERMCGWYWYFKWQICKWIPGIQCRLPFGWMKCQILLGNFQMALQWHVYELVPQTMRIIRSEHIMHVYKIDGISGLPVELGSLELARVIVERHIGDFLGHQIGQLQHSQHLVRPVDGWVRVRLQHEVIQKHIYMTCYECGL